MKYLHVLAFDIPDPPNYGGVIVVYYHLKALAEAGVKVILHAFQYGDRKPSSLLKQFCDQTYYYPRKKKIIDQFSTLPFIVKSRSNPKLLERLKADDHPIFFEGHHTCFYLGHPDLKNRRKIIRLHNIEWQYYNNLAKLETNFAKKAYFHLESQKLRKFDQYVKQHADEMIALSPDDWHYYNNTSIFIPPFHPEEAISVLKGKGDFLLFHGKLSVKDNEKVALFLVNELAPKLKAFKIVIAGLDPQVALIKATQAVPNVQLLANLSNKDMNDLVEKAHIHFLWTFQKAGMKLKLLKALFRGRHCIANALMVENTGLESLCHLCANTNELIGTIQDLMQKEFNDKEINQRKAILEKDFSNKKNVQKTIQLIWK